MYHIVLNLFAARVYRARSDLNTNHSMTKATLSSRIYTYMYHIVLNVFAGRVYRTRSDLNGWWHGHGQSAILH